MSHANAPSMTQYRRAAISYSCAMSGAIPGETFGDLISNARKAKQWSQEDLERASGVSRSTISRWERNQADRPEPEHIRSACRALDIDPRRAAVALGYLSAEEVGFTSPTGPPVDPEIEEALNLLPRIPADKRGEWIDYLRYLVERQEQGRNAS